MSNKKVVVLGAEGYLHPYRSYLRTKGYTKFIQSFPHNSVKIIEDMMGAKVTPSLILFTGGGDISPKMYNEHYDDVFFSDIRDKWENDWFDYAVKNKIPMLGTCRGMQMFTILTGGKLLKHVDNHMGDHLAYTPTQTFMVNSIHHQMCLPWSNTYRLLAWTENQAKVFEPLSYQSKLPRYGKRLVEPEALFFPEVNALGFQWHPEGMSMNSEAHKFVISCLEKYLNV